MLFKHLLYKLFSCHINKRQGKEIKNIHDYCIKLFKIYNILDGLIELLHKSNKLNFLHGVTGRSHWEYTSTGFWRCMQFLCVWMLNREEQVPSKPQATSAGKHNAEPELTITAGYTGPDITSWENRYQLQVRAGQDPDTVQTKPAFICLQTVF